MRFIVNDKIYDTYKAELLCTFVEEWDIQTSIFGCPRSNQNTNLYKTAKGSYFLTCKDFYEKSYIKVISEKKAKRYLMYHNYEKYVEMFGPLEEA